MNKQKLTYIGFGIIITLFIVGFFNYEFDAGKRAENADAYQFEEAYTEAL